MVYTGSLSMRKVLPKKVLKAYASYKNQKTRCGNPKVRSYRDYGQKGIKVEYSVREFVGWYLCEIKKFKGLDPVVGRKDHSKNYAFGNIEIVSRVENSKEATARTKHRFSYPVIAYIKKSGKVLGIFKSMKSASVSCGNSFSTVQRQCKNTNTVRETKIIYNFHKGDKK